MRMLKAISMRRYRRAVGRSLRNVRGRFEGGERRRWGPFVKLGARLRVQARDGHRAAAVQLRPGLFLVAAVPAKNLEPEFGVVPLLAPLMVAAAHAALRGRRRRRSRPQLVGPVADWADEDDLDAAVQADPEAPHEVEHA